MSRCFWSFVHKKGYLEYDCGLVRNITKNCDKKNKMKNKKNMHTCNLQLCKATLSSIFAYTLALLYVVIINIDLITERISWFESGNILSKFFDTATTRKSSKSWAHFAMLLEADLGKFQATMLLSTINCEAFISESTYGALPDRYLVKIATSTSGELSGSGPSICLLYTWFCQKVSIALQCHSRVPYMLGLYA